MILPRARPPLALLVPAAVFIVVSGYALLVLAGVSIGSFSQPSLRHYHAAATQSYLLLKPLGASLVIAAAVSVSATALGALLALLILRTDLPGARAARMLLPLPHIIPGFQFASAWVVIFSRGGLLSALGMEGTLPPYGGVALWLVLTLHLYLPAFLTVAAGLDNIDSSYEEAARIAGLGRARMFFSVLFPLLRPALLSGLLISFALTIEEFGAPSLLGQPTGLVTLTVQIYQLVTTPPLAFGDAAALSVILALLALIVLTLNLRLLARGMAVTVSGKAGHARLIALGKWRWPVTALFWVLLPLATLGPLLALGIVSVLESWGRGYGFGNMTGAHYVAMLASADLRRALLNSLGIAAIVAAAATGFGLAAAYGSVRLRSRLGALLDASAFVMLSMPGLVLGLALILAFSGGAFSLYGSYGILVLAYILRFTGLGARSTAAALHQLSPELESAGRIAGLSPRAVFGRITIPLLKPALVAGAALVFVNSIKEISATSLLISQGHETLAYEAYLRFMEGDYTQGAAISMVMIGTSLVAFALAARMARLRRFV